MKKDNLQNQKVKLQNQFDALMDMASQHLGDAGLGQLLGQETNTMHLLNMGYSQVFAAKRTKQTKLQKKRVSKNKSNWLKHLLIGLSEQGCAKSNQLLGKLNKLANKDLGSDADGRTGDCVHSL